MKYNINEVKSIFTKQICSHTMHKVTYFCNGVSENLTIKMCGSMQFRSLNPASKLYIPSTIEGSCSSQPFGQIKNGLFTGKLACTFSKTKNFSNLDFNHEFQIQLRIYFHPKKFEK